MVQVGQVPPPQSTSVAAPLISPSSQAAAMQRPLLHVLLVQSLATTQR